MMARAIAHAVLGQPIWRAELEEAAVLCREIKPGGRPAIELPYLYIFGVLPGLLRSDTPMLQDTAETLRLAERRGDDFALTAARLLQGFLLLASDGPQRSDGLPLIDAGRKAMSEKQIMTATLGLVDLQNAREKARNDDCDGAIELLRTNVDREFATGNVIYLGAVVTALVEALLQRGTDADVGEAHTVVERLAAVPTEPGFVLYEVALLRLRALLARARGDEISYGHFVDHYHAMATTLPLKAISPWLN